ncbi:MAG: glycoside hydrolase family 28 protein [Bacteroidia bacterium]|nr:glycoside hydrolase family 28 protein [Bacteroidia bacterium]
MKFTILSIVAVLFSGSIAFAQDFNITDYGAKGDGVFLNTTLIQQAIDKAHEKGGGRIIVPKGEFVSGTLVLKSNVSLQLEKGAVLLGSLDPTDYLKLNRWKGFIMADGQSNIGITGQGTINGRGRQVALHLDSLFYAGKLDSSDYNFVERRPKYYTRPQLIEFVGCKGITVKNVHLKNAACWVQTHHECEDILIDSVTTISDAYWNNDGIDIQDCKRVRITNCFVNAADDGICIKSHTLDHHCEDIYIANCTVRSSASAVKFGTRSHGGFRNVEIRNIKVYDTFRSAIAIESVDGGFLEDVLIDGIEATNTANAIFVRLGERYTGGRGAGTIKNVTIKNVKVEVAFERPDYKYQLRGPALPFFHNTFPSSIVGIPEHPVENLSLENIEIKYPGRANKGLAYLPLSRLDAVPELPKAYPEFSMFGELPAWGFYVRHVEGLSMKNVVLSIDDADYRPAMVFDDVKGLNISKPSIQGDSKKTKVVLKNCQKTDLGKLGVKIVE